jgi:hypothetical protein
MSFRCGICGEAQPSRTKGVHVPLKVKIGAGKTKFITDREAYYVEPYQIVQETMACPTCAAMPHQPEVVETQKRENLREVKNFQGKLPPGFQLREDEDFLFLLFNGKEVGKFSHAGEPKEIEKAAEEYLSQ